MEKVLEAIYRTGSVYAEGYILVSDDNIQGKFVDDHLLISSRENQTNLYLTSYNYDTDEMFLYRYSIEPKIDLQVYTTYVFSNQTDCLLLEILGEKDSIPN